VSRVAAIRWWPLFGLSATVLLGLLVGRGSTRVDDWFQQFRHDRWARWLLVFTDARAVVLLAVVAVVVASCRRRWRLAGVTALTPIVAVGAERALKRLFGREKGGALAYPSGHVTVSVVVLGLLVVVAGAAAWTFATAGVLAFLGLLGQAFTYHYFTDTVGAVFLGTSLWCLAVRAAGLDRCQPCCDLGHNCG
jgi:hypothetical protein